MNQTNPETSMRTAPTIVAAEAVTGDASTEPVLTAHGIEKAFRRGVWPPRRARRVLRGGGPGAVTRRGGRAGRRERFRQVHADEDSGRRAGGRRRHCHHNGRLGYCPQEPQAYGRLTCDEHFELFGHAYGISAADERAARRDLYAALGFELYAGTRADQLSGGTLAKLNLGLALLADPDLLLLDEPYAGFDWDTYQKFWTLVAQRRTAGRTVLIISHCGCPQRSRDCPRGPRAPHT